MTQPVAKPLLSQAPMRALRVVSIGECMVEIAASDVPGHVRQSFAGDTYNTAWYLKALQPDWAVRYVTRVGRDGVSRDMMAAMDGAGIDTGHIAASDDRTVGLYMITLDQGERSFSYWRDRSAARQLADDPSLLAEAVADADVVFFSGITLAILALEARDRLLAALSEARAAGKTIAFDPNMRPRLWASAEEMRETILRGAGVADMVLPSFDEEAEQFGDADMAAVIARYRGAGAVSVIVKNGAEPVHYAHMGQAGAVAPEPLQKVVDTTSAGDSFNAGLIAALGHGLPVEAAIAEAARLSRHVIAQHGALVALP